MSDETSVHEQSHRDFAAWVEPHLVAMNRLAGRLVPPADLEDVVQDSLVRAWQRRSTFDPARGSAAAWLLAIVRDQARRRRTRGPAPTAQLFERQVAGPVTAREDEALEAALAALSPRQRLAVDLHYFVGLDVRTCAEVMACAEGTVKATLHQARQRLHTLLGEVGSGHD